MSATRAAADLNCVLAPGFLFWKHEMLIWGLDRKCTPNPSHSKNLTAARRSILTLALTCCLRGKPTSTSELRLWPRENRGLRKTDKPHTNFTKQGLGKKRVLAGENEGSRQGATRDVCSEPKRPARRLSTKTSVALIWRRFSDFRQAASGKQRF